jgi:hypothetical protein
MNADQTYIYVNDRRTPLAAFMAMKKGSIKTVDASGCTALTELKADQAEYVYARGCTALTELKADQAEYVDASGCTALTELKADQAEIKPPSTLYIFGGVDSRGYLFEAVTIRNQWRIIAGCRNYSISDALEHWGQHGDSYRPDCLALVEKIAAEIERREVAKVVAA